MSAPAHAHEFQHKFEDLALLKIGNVDTGLMTGACTVAYWDDEGPQFSVTEIFLEGFRRPSLSEPISMADMRRTWPLVLIKPEENPELHKILYAALEREEFGGIEEAVQEKLEWDRAA